jgi:hypothetical protein
MDENASTTRRSRIHLSEELGDFCGFSFLLAGPSQPLLKHHRTFAGSHVESFYRWSGLSIPSAIKKPPKNLPAENRISSEFWTSLTSIRKGSERLRVVEDLHISNFNGYF